MIIVEERCYVLHATSTPDDYIRLISPIALELQKKVLGDCLGYYKVEIGDLNTVVSLWRYSSFEDRQQRRRRLAAYPEWREFLSSVKPMIRVSRSRLLTPLEACGMPNVFCPGTNHK